MSKKIFKSYIYEGLGFPIELTNVQMILINGEYAPKIDVRLVADQAIKDLVLQKTKLTGNQINFIRNYFEFSLRDFGDIVNESHTAVKKWEHFNNEPTNMDPNIEARIRVYIYEKLCIKTKKDMFNFYKQYQVINEIVSHQQNRKLRRVEAAT